MVKSQDFIDNLNSHDVSPLLMVPCSIFKPLTNWMLNNDVEVIFPPNEAHAMGFAVGSYCASRKLPVIFMQNSGLNNIANCQTSLNLLYKVPTLMVVSWRGEKPEAPEHNIMGEKLKSYFELLDIPFRVLSQNWEAELGEMASLAKEQETPTAVVVRRGFFDEGQSKFPLIDIDLSLSRYKAIRIIKEFFQDSAVFISTNGHASRDSFSVMDSPDFYMMGSMGHAFSIGAGTAWSLAKKNNKNINTVVLDGDGGCLMHLGSLALIGLENLRDSGLVYVVLDNAAYESTGGQPSLASKVDFEKVAEGLGFSNIYSVSEASALETILTKAKNFTPCFIHVKVNLEKKEATRVSDAYSCKEVKDRFIERLETANT